MSRRRFLQAGVVGSALTLLPRALFARPAKPNILFIFLDDLGAEALGCYGGLSYETPRLDALAASGLRFDNCYASPLCIPSRVMTLTGRYPFRTPLTGPVGGRPEERLDPHLPTFASLLRGAGYRSAISGKWQLARLDLYPRHPYFCGFDESLLWLYTRGDRRAARRYWGAELVENGSLRPSSPEDYGPDLECEFLIDFIERHRDETFLAFYPMTLVHGPMLPTPDDSVLAWLASSPDLARLMSTPAATRIFGSLWFSSMVAYADKLVGRLLDALERLGLRERTLVVVSADNGTPSGFESRVGERVIPGGKNTLTEAGTRVPLLASWPGTLPAGVAEDLVDLTDVLPTFAELGGLAIAPDASDGVSLAARLLDGAPSPRSWVFAQRSEQWFVRDRRWRLHHDGTLFDLRDRYSERRAEPGPEAESARGRLAAANPMWRAAPPR